MGKRHINAKEKLWELQHDIKRMLEEGKSTKEIKELIKTRIDRLQDGKYYKVDW